MFNLTDSNFTFVQLSAIVILLLILWLSVTSAFEDRDNETEIHKRVNRVELYVASIVVVNLLKSVFSIANN